eukprot:1709895-Amphidinium_carterae.1
MHQHGDVSPTPVGNAPPPPCLSSTVNEDQLSNWLSFPWNWQWWSSQNRSDTRRAAQCGVSDHTAQEYFYYYQYFYGGSEYNQYGDYSGYYDEYEYAPDEPIDVCAAKYVQDYMYYSYYYYGYNEYTPLHPGGKPWLWSFALNASQWAWSLPVDAVSLATSSLLSASEAVVEAEAQPEYYAGFYTCTHSPGEQPDGLLGSLGGQAGLLMALWSSYYFINRHGRRIVQLCRLALALCNGARRAGRFCFHESSADAAKAAAIVCICICDLALLLVCRVPRRMGRRLIRKAVLRLRSKAKAFDFDDPDDQPQLAEPQ